MEGGVRVLDDPNPNAVTILKTTEDESFFRCNILQGLDLFCRLRDRFSHRDCRKFATNCETDFSEIVFARTVLAWFMGSR